MTRARILSTVALIASALLACNALNGVADLEIGDVASGCGEACVDATAPSRTDATLEGGGQLVDGGASGDATLADAGADAGRPTFCSGITMYVPFEDSLSSKQGQPPDSPPASPPYVPGKYGKALDLSGGTTFLYYTASYAGRAVYAPSAGSVAMWLKSTWAPPCGVPGKTLFKPRDVKGASLTTAGPQLSCGGFTGGLVEVVIEADGGGVTTGVNTGTSSWKANDWNHLVGTWNMAAPRMTLSVNGNARATAPEPWTPGESPANWIRLGSETTVPQAIYDEVAVWDRELTRDEETALFQLTVPLSAACGL